MSISTLYSQAPQLACITSKLDKEGAFLGALIEVLLLYHYMGPYI